MSLEIKIEAFEGPLDLLLHLVEKNKLNIYDIPIAEITDQYLDYVKELASSDLELASEFLLMAAELLMIKSKMLLPKKEEKEEEIILLKEELTVKLLQLKTFKYLATRLGDYRQEGEKKIFGYESIPSNILKYRPKPNVAKLLEGKSSKDIYSSYLDACRRAALKVDPIRSKFKTIEAEKVNVTDRVQSMKTLLTKSRELNFSLLVEDDTNVMTEVVTFLVLLEMMKTGYVEASQDSPLDDIKIIVKKDPETFGESGEFY